MIIDLNSEIRDFSYLSNVYKYIEKFGIMGHQAGRKIGDMLELITMGKIYSNNDLRRRLKIEPKLVGFTSAGHKVEFAFYHLGRNGRLDLNRLFGSIECKKVGVEVTKAQRTKRAAICVRPNHPLLIRFSQQWLDETRSYSINFESNTENTAKISITDAEGTVIDTVDMSIDEDMKFVMDEDGNFVVVKPNEILFDKIPGIMRVCKIFKLSRVARDEAYFETFDCLTGPQTIEKAKQASLVAMDIRRNIDGHWGKEDIAEENKSVISILVIGEFSHWEEKSRNVINTCIDHNLIVPDAVLIKAFELFESEFLDDKNINFWDMISKNHFEGSERVRDVINRVLEYFEGKVFYDIELSDFVYFDFDKNNLVVKTY